MCAGSVERAITPADMETIDMTRKLIRRVTTEEFIEPERFEHYRKMAMEIGFTHVESGPYVRSSYHAAEYGG